MPGNEHSKMPPLLMKPAALTNIPHHTLTTRLILNNTSILTLSLQKDIIQYLWKQYVGCEGTNINTENLIVGQARLTAVSTVVSSFQLLMVTTNQYPTVDWFGRLNRVTEVLNCYSIIWVI